MSQPNNPDTHWVRVFIVTGGKVLNLRKCRWLHRGVNFTRRKWSLWSLVFSMVRQYLCPLRSVCSCHSGDFIPVLCRINFCLNYSFYGQITLFTGKRKENVAYFGFKTFSVCLFTLRTHCRVSLNILLYINVGFKGADSRDRIQVFGHKWTVLVVNPLLSSPLLVFKLSNCSSDRTSSLPLPTRLRWKYIGELLLNKDKSTEYPRCFLNVHCVSSW